VILVETDSTVHVLTAITDFGLIFRNFSAYQEKAFARLWFAFGQAFADDTPKVMDSILSTSHGIILDVGPGAGHQTFRFTNKSGIQAIYGAEPGTGMHTLLKENAEKAGLGQKYKILSCGAELETLVPALAKDGLLASEKYGEGVFDEIVCIRVLCGVSNQPETIKGLYGLLKPGGRFVVCEHVINDGPGGTATGRILQTMYMAMGWSFMMGGCDLKRDTLQALQALGDGAWEENKVTTFDSWGAVPHVIGYLVKKK
jgi:SAM-dependent methyltransferase